MNKQSSLISIVLALIVLAMVVAGCGPTAAPATSAPPSGPAAGTGSETAAPATAPAVQITYFTFSASPDHLAELDAMIQAFQKENPGITVKVETAAFSDYFTKLQALIAGGQAPDVFELNYENFVPYAEKGVLLDLTPLATADKSFDPGIFYAKAYEMFAVNGKQYGLSESFSNVVLFYNKDLFEKAGVPLPTDDWTWDDAIAAARKLTDPTTGQWGLYKPVQFWEFYKTAYQFGCDFFNADKTASNLNDPKCVDALTFMVNLTSQDKVMPTEAEMGGIGDDALFQQGKLAIWPNGIWQFAAMKDVPFKWDIVVEPGQVRKGTHFFSNAVVASKNTRNPEAAWAWLKFFTTSADVAKIRINSAWELPALSDEALVQDYLKQTPPDNRQAVFDSLQYIVIPPVIVKQNEMQDAVNRQLEKARLGQITPQAALDQAKKDVDALLK